MVGAESQRVTYIIIHHLHQGLSKDGGGNSTLGILVIQERGEINRKIKNGQEVGFHVLTNFSTPGGRYILFFNSLT